MIPGTLSQLSNSFASIREFSSNAPPSLAVKSKPLMSHLRTIPVQRDALTGQLKGGQRLARIVDNLILLTKAGTGLIRLSQAPVSLDVLVGDAQADVEALAASISIPVECPVCDFVTVTGGGTGCAKYGSTSWTTR